MKRILAVFCVLLFAGSIGAGCAKSTCEKICDFYEDCGVPFYSDCMDDCVEDYKDRDADCRRAMRDYADCVDENSCVEVISNCQGEADDAYDEC